MTAHTTIPVIAVSKLGRPEQNPVVTKSAPIERNVWRAMKARCLNPSHPNYPRYGARGIRVCPQWLESFAAFLADMGRRPSPAHSLDRIDNDGNYEPGNCRWATRRQQGANTRTNRRIVYRGAAMCVAEAARLAGADPARAYNRLNRHGLPLEEALAPGTITRSGDKHWRAVLTAKIVRDIRQRYRPRKVSQEALAREYGVSRSLIGQVIQRKIWKHV